MSRFYVLGIDQSTQGTKAVLLDDAGKIIIRRDRAHRQIVNEKGWVSHDADEIYQNVIGVCRDAVNDSGVDSSMIRCMGISNQRETTVAWDKVSGLPLANAIVWHCSRAESLCREINERYQCEELVYEKTGMKLSPFWPAAKMRWLLVNEEKAAEAAREQRLALGTVDSYLIYRLTGGKRFLTDFSNAARTQLMQIHKLMWDSELCSLFRIPPESLPEIVDSDSEFGFTDLEGFLKEPIPICGVLGDSNAALFGHNCTKTGDIKVTYGTGSSVMLNIGDRFLKSGNGLATSLAWRIRGKASYVLEGNITYTGAVITWLKDTLKLIGSPQETGKLAKAANPEDTTYMVPAFTGLGAPWWKSEAKAMIWGMMRSSGKNEVVKAACDSIAYQINDVIEAMRNDTGLPIAELCVDGGPTKNDYLMQFQSDIAGAVVRIPDTEELSVLGASFLAGINAGLWSEKEVYQAVCYQKYEPGMEPEIRSVKTNGWNEAVRRLIG